MTGALPRLESVRSVRTDVLEVALLLGAMTPIRPDLEAGLWYLYSFLTDRGRAGLTASRRDIAKVIYSHRHVA